MGMSGPAVVMTSRGDRLPLLPPQGAIRMQLARSFFERRRCPVSAGHQERARGALRGASLSPAPTALEWPLRHRLRYADRPPPIARRPTAQGSLSREVSLTGT